MKSHQRLFQAYELEDGCGLQTDTADATYDMRGAVTTSTALLTGLTRTELSLDEAWLESQRSNFMKSLHAEYDAELFCQEIERREQAGRLKMSAAFREFEKLWRRDELDHAIGFAKVYSVLYEEDEKDVLARLYSRQADFSRLEPFLQDELSVCLLLAYDELATTLSYSTDGRELYPRLQSPQLNRWIRRLAADEARHYRNLLNVLRSEHTDQLYRAGDILDQIFHLDTQRIEYAGTFVLDHDDPLVFPPAILEQCRHRLMRQLGLEGCKV